MHKLQYQTKTRTPADIMVGDRTATRQIVIRRRNNYLQFISDTHRSYDGLLYPLIFWKGQDGYCVNFKQRNHVAHRAENYSYRLMIRRGRDNFILQCRAICQKFMVDMYVRAEEYIYLRDAVGI